MLINAPIIFLFLIALLLCGCKEKWQGVVYPDKNNLTLYAKIGYFPSLKECAVAARSTLDAFSRYGLGDYECASGCDGGAELGEIEICEETSK